MPLDPPNINELKAIVDWVNLAEDVRELSIKFGDVELFVSRDGRPAVQRPAEVIDTAAPAELGSRRPMSSANAPTSPPPIGPEQSMPAQVDTETFSADRLAQDEVLITAPMIGTFYASPKPGDPPFVSVGDGVGATTVVGIVEVMKLMNNLEAKVEGIVSRILVGNEDAVEFGQPLMVISRRG